MKQINCDFVTENCKKRLNGNSRNFVLNEIWNINKRNKFLKKGGCKKIVVEGKDSRNQ